MLNLKRYEFVYVIGNAGDMSTGILGVFHGEFGSLLEFLGSVTFYNMYTGFFVLESLMFFLRS